MSKRTAGAALIGLGLLLAVVAFGYWQWQESDSQQDKRETAALTAAFAGQPLEVEEADHTGSFVLLGFAAVAFLGGIVLVAVSPPPGTPDASDRQSQGSAIP